MGLEPLPFQQISPSLVLSHLRKLYIRKATGLDTVSARFLREYFDLFFNSLALIFNRSTETSIFLMNGRAQGSLLSTRNVAIEVTPEITSQFQSFLWWLRSSGRLSMISYIVI